MNVKYCETNNDYVFSSSYVDVYFDSFYQNCDLVFFKMNGETVGSITGDICREFIDIARSLGIPELNRGTYEQ